MAGPVIAQLVAGFARALRPTWAICDPWRSGRAQAALLADASASAAPRGQLSLELAWAAAATRKGRPSPPCPAEAGTSPREETPAPPGLANVSGAACYANAVSQILLADPGLGHWLELDDQPVGEALARPWLCWLLERGAQGAAAPLAAWTGLPAAP